MKLSQRSRIRKAPAVMPDPFFDAVTHRRRGNAAAATAEQIQNKNRPFVSEKISETSGFNKALEQEGLVFQDPHVFSPGVTSTPQARPFVWRPGMLVNPFLHSDVFIPESSLEKSTETTPVSQTETRRANLSFVSAAVIGQFVTDRAKVCFETGRFDTDPSDPNIAISYFTVKTIFHIQDVENPEDGNFSSTFSDHVRSTTNPWFSIFLPGFVDPVSPGYYAVSESQKVQMKNARNFWNGAERDPPIGNGPISMNDIVSGRRMIFAMTRKFTCRTRVTRSLGPELIGTDERQVFYSLSTTYTQSSVTERLF